MLKIHLVFYVKSTFVFEPKHVEAHTTAGRMINIKR